MRKDGESVCAECRGAEEQSLALGSASAARWGGVSTEAGRYEVGGTGGEDRAEQALRRSEMELAAIYEHAPIMMMLLDPDLKIVRINARAREYIGTSAGAPEGLRWGDALGCADATGSATGCGSAPACSVCPVHTAVSETLGSGVSHKRVAMTVRCGSDGAGQENSLLASTARLGMDDGYLVLLCLEDVTERHALERQFRQAQKMEAIGLLAGGIAHDFNNILTPILGNAELALEELPEGSPLRRGMRGIVVAAARAQSLIAQILTMSRRDEAASAVPVNVSALVKETSKLLRATLPATIKIVLDAEGKSGSVLADPSSLHQVVINLCTNAAYAMRESGGTLTLSVRREGGPGPGRLRLSVSDTGQGIPEGVKERMFEPYFTTKPPGEGTGLGLFTVRGIVESLGGEIRVCSAEGEGTRFDVDLPSAPRAEEPLRAEREGAPRGQGERVLVVDDEGPIRAVLLKLLRSLGYVVIAHKGSDDALKAFR